MLQQRALRTTHSTTQIVGLGLIALSLAIVVLVSVLVLDATEELSFVFVVIGVAAGAMLLVWRFDALWSRIAGIVANFRYPT